ncbi:hypothetical protein BDW22DRAFT_1481657 [Trametopsis cervina]|nr:hypothetical protein BDW22DRAFT_1481657 [Trametopsis cervina]
MRSFSIVAVATTLINLVSASAILAREEKALDWKHSIGWHGSVLPADAIGTVTSVSSNETHIEKRTIGGVYICTDIHWGGRCGYAVQQLGACISLGSDWNHQISSFGPDDCTTCQTFASSDCSAHESLTSGNNWWISYPGDATGGSWNDKISSFRCTAYCNTFGQAKRGH